MSLPALVAVEVIPPVAFIEMLVLAKPNYENKLGGAQGKYGGDKGSVWEIVELPKNAALFDRSSEFLVHCSYFVCECFVEGYASSASFCLASLARLII